MQSGRRTVIRAGGSAGIATGAAIDITCLKMDFFHPVRQGDQELIANDLREVSAPLGLNFLPTCNPLRTMLLGINRNPCI